MKRDELKQLLLDDFGNLTDKQLMALVIYGEARGEGREGQIAVGSVILERVEHRDWDGNDIKSVCLMPYQFSCFLPADSNYIALKLTAKNFEAQYERSSSLQKCYAIASGLIDGTIERTPEIVKHNACQYCTTAWRKQLDEMAANEKDPAKLAELNKKRWWSRMKLVFIAGHHEFYA